MVTERELVNLQLRKAIMLNSMDCLNAIRAGRVDDAYQAAVDAAHCAHDWILDLRAQYGPGVGWEPWREE